MKVRKASEGWILEVDLSTRRVRTFAVADADRRRFLGGKGLGLWYLYGRLAPGVDPLGADNILAVMTGVLPGTGAPCSGRFSAVSKSPLTGIFTASSCGGPFGLALRTAGYEGLLISGRAAGPVVLEVSDGRVDFRDAAELWGAETDTARGRLALSARDGELVIGPAGENRVLFANIASGHRFLGRGGLGAVMGSKNLKAVVARGGAYRIVPVRAAAFRKVKKRATAAINANFMTSDLYRRYGTNAGTRFCNRGGILPVRNFAQGSHDSAEDVSGEAMAARYRSRYRTCRPCTILCGHRGTLEDGSTHQIPEYETVGMLGASLGVFDSDRIVAWNDICGRVGMDTVSTGSTLAWAMEAGEKGLLEVPLRFGSPQGIPEILEDIAHRRGLGNELADGTRRLSERYGGREFAMHVKGLEMAAYDPRGAWGQGLAYAVANRGGCHLSAYLVAMEIYFGLLHPYRTGAKPEFTRFLESVGCCINALHTCQFTMYAYMMEAPLTRYTPDFLLGFLMQHLPRTALALTDFSVYTRLWAAATGIRVSNRAFFRAGDRIHVLERYMNTREGISRRADTLPPRLLESGRSDDPAGRTVPLEAMLAPYYRIRGYDQNGVPTRATLRRLGLLEETGGPPEGAAKAYREVRAGGGYFKRRYVGLMLWFMGRAIQAASRVDGEVRGELGRLPAGFTFALGVLPAGPAMVVAVEAGGRARHRGGKTAGRPVDLHLGVKHLDAALRMFTFRESTADAIARNRLTVAGETGAACTVVRVFNIVEVYLLPRFLASLAVKRYPSWGLGRRWVGRLRLYGRALLGM